MPDRAPPNPEVLRELVLGDSTEILLDQVVSVERIAFVGHVYNLETLSGWYVAEGIVSHNCRCMLAPIANDEALTKVAGPTTGVVGQL